MILGKESGIYFEESSTDDFDSSFATWTSKAIQCRFFPNFSNGMMTVSTLIFPLRYGTRKGRVVYPVAVNIMSIIPDNSTETVRVTEEGGFSINCFSINKLPHLPE